MKNIETAAGAPPTTAAARVTRHRVTAATAATPATAAAKNAEKPQQTAVTAATPTAAAALTPAATAVKDNNNNKEKSVERTAGGRETRGNLRKREIDSGPVASKYPQVIFPIYFSAILLALYLKRLFEAENARIYLKINNYIYPQVTFALYFGGIFFGAANARNYLTINK